MNKMPPQNTEVCSQKQNRWTVAFASFVLISAATGFLFDAHYEQRTIEKAISTIDLYQFEYLG
ncbi:hypothetical protein [Marinomonas mediterranea]|jgi:hypothetical protein|uniref:Uncharacterized protein n=1 Tax=Marinomonas mediterranea (strain ATCC 700492 / JCM 21426 / NBRC 103028 / MMB-1) TaxID=717774 RepID=F2JWD1_MARM1|nr:hypothetical protein [Marinomonas mediterranea]ADZ90604.1 hypothetical protein Marme_1331 [Marinomonas mediterranea MMB-1]WCN08646.1 hypothetical protein GV055_06740 [Marinomonas mediterranea]WCN12701.1 hypothetical protein GV054_06580 [Marinomonas mediterranea]WCN16774.1 hypothetical protein GV053_06720 [Marinomonas mediterranea MMB-1]